MIAEAKSETWLAIISLALQNRFFVASELHSCTLRMLEAKKGESRYFCLEATINTLKYFTLRCQRYVND